MTDNNFYKATGKKAYTTLESHPLISEYGMVYIFKEIEEDYYVAVEGQPDRGAPYFDYWKIKADLYAAFLNPTIDNLQQLLAAKFFNSTLFDVFIQNEYNLDLLHQIMALPKPPKIEDNSVRNWVLKEKQKQLNDALFQPAESLGVFELPEVVHATQFLTDNQLELDILQLNATGDKYVIQRHLLTIDNKSIVPQEEVDVNNGIPFFTFAKDYPIKSVVFGNENQYTAEVVGQEKVSGYQKVRIKNGTKKIYEYAYPRAANLGRFWVFEEATDDEFKNSLLFMYSMRDHALNDNYYVLRFEVIEQQVYPRTMISAKGNSIMSVSPNGRLVFTKTEVEGRRSNYVEIVQL